MVGATEALYLTPWTIIGQIKALGGRLQGKLLKRKGHGLEPNGLGESVFRYVDKTFILSQEALDIVNYRKESSLLFDVDVADMLSKQLISSILDAAVVGDEQVHLRYFKSTREMLLDQLSQHKLDMTISDCPIDSTQQEGLFSAWISECNADFRCTKPLPEKSFPAYLEKRQLLIPGCRSMLGRELLNWINSQGLNIEILGEFDDATLMEAFGAMHNTIFVAPTPYSHDFYTDGSVVETGCVENMMEEHHAVFAERVIQHPAVQRICNADYPALSTLTNK